MEVHHHTHLASGETHTARRKWTHYFWEFLMLFLAVTLGFFVENQREHYIEHKRAKELGVSLVEDLKADTAAIHFITEISLWYESKLDTLLQVLKEPLDTTNETRLYYYTSFLPLTLYFRANDATFRQLSNSGSLRYLRNIELYKAITIYYTEYENYRELIDYINPNYPSSQDLIEEIFDALEFSQLSNSQNEIYNSVRYPDHSLQLRNKDTRLLNKLYSKASLLKGLSKLSRTWGLDKLATQAADLIKKLTSEYDMD